MESPQLLAVPRVDAIASIGVGGSHNEYGRKETLDGRRGIDLRKRVYVLAVL